MSPEALWRTVQEVAMRAGIAAHSHPHLLRHAFGDHIAKQAGLRTAQALLRHASVDTTAGTSLDHPGLDESSISVHGFSYARSGSYPSPGGAKKPVEATTGIEPV